MLLGIGLSTVMIGQYARIGALGLVGLVGLQLLFVGLGGLLASRVRPQLLLGVLLVTTVLSAFLGVLAPRPVIGNEMVVAWRSGPWVLMVLPGVLVFATWLGAVVIWSGLKPLDTRAPMADATRADEASLSASFLADEAGLGVPAGAVPREDEGE